MKERIFINMHYMELGGAERALLGLLNAIDTNRVEVDLFLNQHTGDFMPLIPKKINLLPELRGYNAIERPLKDVLLEGQWRVALDRLRAKREHARYHRSLSGDKKPLDSSVFQLVMDRVVPHLKSLDSLGCYDLAISFLQPHNIVLDKVRAKKKICWIHTDYSTVHINVEQELRVWQQYDHIISISDDCTRAFVNTFPSLAPKIVKIENILSPAFVRGQARLTATPELDACEGVKIVSVGRICHAKNYDNVPLVAQMLKERGLKFCWFIVGPGSHEGIDRLIEETGTSDCIRFLGVKSSPYPYIKACDLYVQPSRYEGKSVTVREAQMLGKPVVVTNYPTASSQVRDGEDGIICPMSNEGIAQAIWELAHDVAKQNALSHYCLSHDYGNEAEVHKIYQLISTDLVLKKVN